MYLAHTLLLMCQVAFAAPSFKSRDIEGNMISLKNYSGDIVMINFWATWCSPCMAEMPHLQKIEEKYLDNFKLITVSVDEARDKSKIKPHIKKNNYTFTVIHDPTSSIMMLYNPQGYLPYNVILDSKGKIIWTGAGYEPGKELIIEKILDNIIKK